MSRRGSQAPIRFARALALAAAVAWTALVPHAHSAPERPAVTADCPLGGDCPDPAHDHRPSPHPATNCPRCNGSLSGLPAVPAHALPRARGALVARPRGRAPGLRDRRASPGSPRSPPAAA